MKTLKMNPDQMVSVVLIMYVAIVWCFSLELVLDCCYANALYSPSSYRRLAFAAHLLRFFFFFASAVSSVLPIFPRTLYSTVSLMNKLACLLGSFPSSHYVFQLTTIYLLFIITIY